MSVLNWVTVGLSLAAMAISALTIRINRKTRALIKAMEAPEGPSDDRNGFRVVQGRKTWARPAETPSEAVDGPTGGTDS